MINLTDAGTLNRVYSTGTKFLKEPAMFKFAGDLDALPFITDPAAHKIRRGIVNPMFSPNAIRDFSSPALEIIKAALEKVGEAHESRHPISLKSLESNFAVR